MIEYAAIPPAAPAAKLTALLPKLLPDRLIHKEKQIKMKLFQLKSLTVCPYYFHNYSVDCKLMILMILNHP
jgi:hypothetical protein